MDGGRLRHPEGSLPGEKGQFTESFACQKSTEKTLSLTSKASSC